MNNVFYSAEQQANEIIDQYLLHLQCLAEPCKSTVLHDKMHDWLVLGVRDKAARAHLFREKECSLAKAVELLRISEATLEQLTVIGGKEDETVNTMNKHPRRKVPDNTVQKVIKAMGKSQPQSCRYCGGKQTSRKAAIPSIRKVLQKVWQAKSVCRLQPPKKVMT